MSRRNREKRAAKRKERLRASAGREYRSFFAEADRAVIQEILVAALQDAAMCPEHDPERHVAELLADFPLPGRDLDIAADTALAGGLRAAWKAGWLPVDLHEHARRHLDSTAVDYLAETIVVESRRYAPATMHPQWRASLAAIPAGDDPLTATPHLRHWATRNAGCRSSALEIALEALALLGSLPVLEQLLPPPGESPHGAPATAGADSGDVDDKVLAKVRALLAKAESTEYPDEAEALSAKAQELMSRYSLHQAVRDHDRGRAPAAFGRRLWMDAPYAGAKAHLVQAVATANRCRAVWTANLGFVTVVGSETDLDIVELLTTSLLVQANRAMLVADRHATSRIKSFRQSFLVAYATRIGERLEAASAVGTAQARADGRLLPVLAARSRAADELTDRLFPRVVRRSVPVSNGAGWGAGRAAADLALFDVHGAVAG